MASTVRKPLWLLLVGSGLMSAAALWWPANPSSKIVAPVAREQARLAGLAGDLQPMPVPAAPRRLPAGLPAHRLDPAEFDPFVGVQPPAPPPLVAPVPRPMIGPVYEPPPPPPPLNYRYLGQMLDPAGKRLFLTGKLWPTTFVVRLKPLALE